MENIIVPAIDRWRSSLDTLLIFVSQWHSADVQLLTSYGSTIDRTLFCYSDFILYPGNK